MGDADLIKLTDAQQKSAEEAFNGFDKKNEGKIKAGDIAAAMKKMNLNCKADWLEKMEEYIDTEGTGYVPLEEFIELVRRKIQADEDERELKEIFRVLDKEKKGEVNVNELRWILKNLGDDFTEEDIDDMINDVDTDGSGWVDYDEFSKLMLG
jgi:Ca2+-binding EF-hand superfamily protein